MAKYFDSDGVQRPSYWNSEDEAQCGHITQAEFNKVKVNFKEPVKK